MKYGIDDPKKRGNRSTQKWIDLHTLWHEMNLNEQVAWLNRAKRIFENRARNWLIHVCLGAAIISIIFITTIPPHAFHGYVYALIGGYIISFNIFIFQWIIEKYSYKRHG